MPIASAPMKFVPFVFAATLAVATVAPIQPAIAQSVDQRASGAVQLRQLLRTHIYNGFPVSRAARAATGDPNITVIDRRTGGASQCSFLNRFGRRILQCNS